MTTNGTDLDLLTCDGGKLWNRVCVNADLAGWTESFAALRDRIVAAVHAASPSLLEARREAASKAWDAAYAALRGVVGITSLASDMARDRYLAATYPIVPPTPSVTVQGVTFWWKKHLSHPWRWRDVDGYESGSASLAYAFIGANINARMVTDLEMADLVALAAEQSEAR